VLPKRVRLGALDRAVEVVARMPPTTGSRNADPLYAAATATRPHYPDEDVALVLSGPLGAMFFTLFADKIAAAQSQFGRASAHPSPIGGKLVPPTASSVAESARTSLEAPEAHKPHHTLEDTSMTRIHVVRRGLLVGVTAAVAIAAIAVPAGATSAHAARTEKIQLRHTSQGKVLVDSSGFTVFHFSKDTGKKNTCLTTSECSTTWPALTTSGQPTAGPGVSSSLLSTIKLSNGQRQVTYAGHPLYRYAVASERGETSYIGVKQFGGTWYALSASGANVK
jgi:predicted lipoprotein with Yx(FWY)xxD motif